jgi:hypothetical protein
MRLFLFSLIISSIGILNAQKQNYLLFSKDKIYTCSNNELNINFKIYELNKKLTIESNFCPECTDDKYYSLKLKTLNKDFYYFEIADYFFIIDLSTSLPFAILINSNSLSIKNQIFNPN